MKIAPIEDRASLSRLWQAIVDNTKGDLFWLGEILLNELEKETGFRPPMPQTIPPLRDQKTFNPLKIGITLVDDDPA